MADNGESRKRPSPGREGDRVSLAPLSFDEALDALVDAPECPRSTSEADPESESEEPRTVQRPKPSDDST